jgi:hypothetical protein
MRSRGFVSSQLMLETSSYWDFSQLLLCGHQCFGEVLLRILFVCLQLGPQGEQRKSNLAERLFPGLTVPLHEPSDGTIYFFMH